MFDSLRYLVLAITSRCNIQCEYCHQSASVQGTDMSDDVIEASLNLVDNGHPLFIQITGGEPTLIPNAIERIVHKSHKMKVRPHLAIQTNGTLLNTSLVHLFKKHQIQVGVSIDGPPDIQEKLRGNTNATLKGIALLEQAGVIFRVTTVVNNKNVLFLDQLALLLAGYGSCRGIGLDLLVEKGRGTTSLDVFPATTEHIYKGIRCLVHTLASLNSRRRNPLLLRELEHVKKGSSNCSFCHAASGKSLAVQADGRLFSCGQTLGDPAFSCGSVSSPYLKTDSLLTKLKLQNKQCDSCPLQNRCPGECPSRIHYNCANKSNLVCELYRCLDALL